MEQANFYVSISQIIHHCCTFSFIKNTLTFYCFVHFDTHATKFCHFLLAAAKSAGAKSFPIKSTLKHFHLFISDSLHTVVAILHGNLRFNSRTQRTAIGDTPSQRS